MWGAQQGWHKPLPVWDPVNGWVRAWCSGLLLLPGGRVGGGGRLALQRGPLRRGETPGPGPPFLCLTGHLANYEAQERGTWPRNLSPPERFQVRHHCYLAAFCL